MLNFKEKRWNQKVEKITNENTQRKTFKSRFWIKRDRSRKGQNFEEGKFHKVNNFEFLNELIEENRKAKSEVEPFELYANWLK